MEKDKDLISLRLATDVNLKTKMKAEQIGVSQNALLNIFIDLGMRAYESELGFIPRRQE